MPIKALFKDKISAEALFGKDGLVNLWTLDRKTSDILTEQGASTHEIGHTFHALKILYPFIGKKLTEHNVFRGLFASDEISTFLQVHEWDGETWFTKEAAEQCLRLLFAAWSVWGERALVPKNLENVCFRTLADSEYKKAKLPM